jgi:gluconate 2-dehydrogenase subunit 3-like protein
MLIFGRRGFLAGIAWVSVLLGRRARAFAQPGVANPLPPPLRATLEAVADTIVPRDEDSGAVDAGVPARIVAHLSTHAEALALYREGLELVDRLARETGASSFAALAGPARERLLTSLPSGPGGPRKMGEAFFVRVRRDVLAFFWGSVTGQRVVDYRPPLAGYPDYADPPSPARRPQP